MPERCDRIGLSDLWMSGLYLTTANANLELEFVFAVLFSWA